MTAHDTIFRIAWEKLPPELIQGHICGEYGIYNGVLRNRTKNFEIVKHMPFEPMSLSPDVVQRGDLLEISRSIQSAQTVITGAIAVSTLAIMGTVIVSTAYLSHKINKIQKAIENIQKEIHDQNIIFYATKISEYFGAVESLRELICFPTLVEENRDLILMKISDLGTKRCQMLSLVESIFHISDGFTPENKSIAIDFINMSLELIPKGVWGKLKNSDTNVNNPS